MKYGFIGSGKMNSAMAVAVSKYSTVNDNLYVSDVIETAAKSLAERIGATVSENIEIVQECDVVFLGIKPQVIGKVLDEISSYVREKTIFVSMAAAISIDYITEKLGNIHLIRIMPNSPVMIGEGLILYSLYNISDEQEKNFKLYMTYTGSLLKCNESLIDSLGAISGCGPAFAYMFIESLADGGVECGVSRDDAVFAAAQTLKGAAQMVMESGLPVGKLREDVCSPNGTTIAGVNALEKNAFRYAVAESVKEAYNKTLKMKKG